MGTPFRTTIRPNVLAGPLGGYKNQPDITFRNDTVTGTDASTYIDIRPPVGEIWAPTLIGIWCTSVGDSGTGRGEIAMFDGTTFSRIDYFKGIAVGGATGHVVYGSSATGAIRLTNSKYLRIALRHDGGAAAGFATFETVVSIDRVI